MNSYASSVFALVGVVSVSMAAAEPKSVDTASSPFTAEQNAALTNLTMLRTKETPLVQKTSFDKPIKLQLQAVPLVVSAGVKEVSFQWRK